MNPTRSILKFIFWLSALIILIAGLDPKDFSLTDSATQSAEKGVNFSKYALGLSEPFLDERTLDTLNLQGFSMELELAPARVTHNNFMVVTTINNGVNEDQFLIGQWTHMLIVMQGDDYPNRTRQPRLNIDTRQLPKDLWMLKLMFSPDGAAAIHNGKVIASNPSFIVELPKTPLQSANAVPDGEQTPAPQASYMTFGNTLDRRHGWMGGIKAIRINSLQAKGDHFVAGESIAKYDFTTDILSAESADASSVSMRVLPNSTIKQYQWFGTSSDYFQNGKLSAFDIVLNFSGFIPFGLTFCGLMLLRNGRAASLFKTVALTVILSLVLEFAQGAIPSRDSTLFDVLFNVAGGLAGALIWLFFWTLAQPPKEDEEILPTHDKSAAPVE